ncbi:DUF3857 domain-containing protein [Formosa sp. Hel1_33_131]|uniref:DUF3857 domain-containing protein n=1 Tax=Formosa sp. Hel1_33_131 TaxID=1336794 RepID=UPI0018D3FA7C|nr:DUF3857 domain-containing protein [Formosa sp. Hel1_33_131]
MSVKEKRIITILNKKGNENIDAFVYYDRNVKIKTLQVLAFDALGNQIKKIKKNDFKDVSAVDGGTLYSDSRVKYLEYTPIDYPYTIQFTCETTTGNTAFIPSFVPIDDYFVSTEVSTYALNYPTNITIRKKEKNIENRDIEIEAVAGRIFYKTKNMNALKPEEYSPSMVDFAPKILVAANEFTYEGVYAEAENWNDFGKWVYFDLIESTIDLPESTAVYIQDLVKDEKTDIGKAKKIYQYVQDKVRYISVQVGIGGWKPFNASEVDRLGYGDCKGLTNYTMSLLKAVGVNSNFTLLFAGNSQRDIEKDFTIMQANHAILSIPQKNKEDIWLECTNQKLPFGFIGDFTDNRDVLVITPQGGQIKHTKKYTTEENTQLIKANYKVFDDGTIDVNATLKSKGIQYDDKYWLETETERDLDKHYKNRWGYINDISINEISIVNDKESIVFNETVRFKAINYSKIIANRMLLTVNALNRNTHIPDRYRNRKLPLKIKRGFKDIDEVEITLPQNYKVESLPNKKIIENKFGSYKSEVIAKDENTLIYKREFVVSDGEFPKEDYSSFRDFYKEVSKQDTSKIALIKKE